MRSKAKCDPSIEKGYQWIVQHIKKNWDNLNSRVEKETGEQYESERKDIEERLKRFREHSSKSSFTAALNDEHRFDKATTPFQPIKEVVKQIEQADDSAFIKEQVKPNRPSGPKITPTSEFVSNSASDNDLCHIENIAEDVHEFNSELLRKRRNSHIETRLFSPSEHLIKAEEDTVVGEVHQGIKNERQYY